MAHHHSLPPIDRGRKSSRRRGKLSKLLLLLSPLGLPFLWLGYRNIENTWIEPEVIFVLGGETQRETFAAQFALKHPDLPVWISGGAPAWYPKKVFLKAGVPLRRLHVDRSSVDTVTNFTSLADRLQADGVTSVYLITSNDHMSRARAIGEIIFGSRGIKIKPVTFDSYRESEPIYKTLRDSARSIVWLATGVSGAKSRIRAQ
jgi:uncharacterized SAM-binding protein YcdF (DUF218 family)